MKKNIFIIIFFICFLNACLKSIPISIPENIFFDDDKQCHELKIVANPFYPPFSVVVGAQYFGFGIDLVTEVLTKAEIPFSFIITDSWNESVDLILKGKADLIMGAYYNSEVDFISYLEPHIGTDMPMILFKRELLNKHNFAKLGEGKKLYLAFYTQSNCKELSLKITQGLTEFQQTHVLNDFILKSLESDYLKKLEFDKNQLQLTKEDEDHQNTILKPINILGNF